MGHFFWLKPPDAAITVFMPFLNYICYNIWSVILHLESKIIIKKKIHTVADVLVW